MVNVPIFGLKARPFATPIETVLFCKALALPNCKVPALMVVWPVIVFAAVSLVVPLPIWFSAPVPLMTLATTSAVSLRSKLSVALLTTGPLPSVPLAPPLPIRNVPALMNVVPE